MNRIEDRRGVVSNFLLGTEGPHFLDRPPELSSRSVFADLDAELANRIPLGPAQPNL